MLITIDQTYILYGIAGLLIIVLLWTLALQLKLRKLLIGKDIKELERTFVGISNDLKALKSFKDHAEKLHVNFDTRIKRSIQGVETIRFNPFKGTGAGGNQSFALALIDEKGDGTVLSSLYSHNHISVFAKGIKNGTSEFGLTEEETNALAKAQEKAQSKK